MDSLRPETDSPPPPAAPGSAPELAAAWAGIDRAAADVVGRAVVHADGAVIRPHRHGSTS